MGEIEVDVLVESLLAELAHPALGVVHAVLADAAAHVASGGKHVRVEEARAGVVVAVASWKSKAGFGLIVT